MDAPKGQSLTPSCANAEGRDTRLSKASIQAAPGLAGRSAGRFMVRIGRLEPGGLGGRSGKEQKHSKTRILLEELCLSPLKETLLEGQGLSRFDSFDGG